VINLAEYPSLYANPTQEASDMYLSFVLSFFSLSLVENALATGLIVSKIVIVHRSIRAMENTAKGLGRDMVPIISILIESGMLTFVAQLVQIFMFKFANDAYPIIGGPVVMLYVRVLLSIIDLMVFDYIYPIKQGISSAIVLVRVEMGLIYDVDSKNQLERHAYVLHSKV
jgi:hypothetical protein